MQNHRKSFAHMDLREYSVLVGAQADLPTSSQQGITEVELGERSVLSIKLKTRVIVAFAGVACLASWANAQGGSFLDSQWAALNPGSARDIAAGGGGSYSSNAVDGKDDLGAGVVVAPLPSAALLGTIGLGIIAGVHRRRPVRS